MLKIRLPASVPVLVIGAGVHGLSTAWHLAEQGRRVLVVDKTGVAAGASGIACGVDAQQLLRRPAMSELMAACVEVWESDPEALHYHGSRLHRAGSGRAGERPASRPTSVSSGSATRPSCTLEKKRSPRTCASCTATGARPGPIRACTSTPAVSAFNRESMEGLAAKADAGAEIRAGVEVTGFDLDDSGAVTAVHHQRTTRPEQVVVAVGPWITDLVVDARAPRPRSTSASPMARSTPICRCGRTGT